MLFHVEMIQIGCGRVDVFGFEIKPNFGNRVETFPFQV